MYMYLLALMLLIQELCFSGMKATNFTDNTSCGSVVLSAVVINM